MTATSVMAKSSSRLVSPAKKLFVWTMDRNSSCRTLKPLPFCDYLMQLLQYNKEGLSAKSTWRIYSAKDLLISNICTISQANGSLVDKFLRIAMTTTIIENGSEGIVRSGLRVYHQKAEAIVKCVCTERTCSENVWLQRVKPHK